LFLSLVFLRLGLVYYKTGDFTKSLDNLNKAMEICREKNWRLRQCNTNIALGNVYRMQRRFDEAAPI